MEYWFDEEGWLRVIKMRKLILFVGNWYDFVMLVKLVVVMLSVFEGSWVLEWDVFGYVLMV